MSARGRCEGCGETVTIDVPPDGHTRAEHAPTCRCQTTNDTCPVPALCGPVRAEEE